MVFYRADIMALEPQRARFIRRALELAERNLSEASSKIESVFVDLASDIDDYPELEQFALDLQTLYTNSQDQIGEIIAYVKQLKKIS